MSQIPDNAPVFEEPPRSKFGSYCFHESYTVNGHQRLVTCNKCQAALDPFEIVERWARRVYVRDDVERQIAELRDKLAALHADEKRTKARLRGAKKKDADIAVAKERAAWAAERARIIFELRLFRNSASGALERLGAVDDDDGDGWKLGNKEQPQ